MMKPIFALGRTRMMDIKIPRCSVLGGCYQRPVFSSQYIAPKSERFTITVLNLQFPPSFKHGLIVTKLHPLNALLHRMSKRYSYPRPPHTFQAKSVDYCLQARAFTRGVAGLNNIHPLPQRNIRNKFCRSRDRSQPYMTKPKHG